MAVSLKARNGVLVCLPSLHSLGLLRPPFSCNPVSKADGDLNSPKSPNSTTFGDVVWSNFVLLLNALIGLGRQARLEDLEGSRCGCTRRSRLGHIERSDGGGKEAQLRQVIDGGSEWDGPHLQLARPSIRMLVAGKVE
ncbi:hypothetical protein F5Y05DRAFT_408207 [Hypoxylon sp. FL0543]|nr:hypothetical protein F5Y05DRAFT_408207 [Hypoxylon sp. FL0543]